VRPGFQEGRSGERGRPTAVGPARVVFAVVALIATGAAAASARIESPRGSSPIGAPV
jgi:hypothetical protein